MKLDAFNSLRKSQGAGIAAVDSGSASLFLTQAYSDKEYRKVTTKLTNIENAQADARPRWKPDDDQYKAALNKVRDQRVTR